MLVLTRKVGERIRIGNEIVVVIRAIQGKRIKLGIDADKSVHVVRGELLKHSLSRHAPTEAHCG